MPGTLAELPCNVFRYGRISSPNPLLITLPRTPWPGKRRYKARKPLPSPAKAPPQGFHRSATLLASYPLFPLCRTRSTTRHGRMKMPAEPPITPPRYLYSRARHQDLPGRRVANPVEGRRLRLPEPPEGLPGRERPGRPAGHDFAVQDCLPGRVRRQGPGREVRPRCPQKGEED
jgi:hypothetical protein